MAHLRQLGYSDARQTSPGADAGADVIATGVVAHVKYWVKPVGAPPIRDLHGTAMAQRAVGVFYSGSGYTPHAVEWAIEAGVALFVYDGGAVRPMSPAAWRLAAAGGGSSARPAGIFRQVRIDTNGARVEASKAALEKAAQRAERLALVGRPKQRERAVLALRQIRQVKRLLNQARTLDPGDRGWRRLLATVDASIKDIRRLL